MVQPTVAKGKGRVRVMVTAIHTKQQLDKAVDAFTKIGKEMKII